jgi:hypothetical protein
MYALSDDDYFDELWGTIVTAHECRYKENISNSAYKKYYS